MRAERNLSLHDLVQSCRPLHYFQNIVASLRHMLELCSGCLVCVQPFDRLPQKYPLRFSQRKFAFDLIGILRRLHQTRYICAIADFGFFQIVDDNF